MESEDLAKALTTTCSFKSAFTETPPPPPTPGDECEKADILKSLNTIERIVNMLKFDATNNFATMLEKLLEIAQQTKKEMKFELISTVLSNIFQASTDELALIQQEFKKIFDSKIDKKFIVNDDLIREFDEILGRGAFGIVTSGILIKPSKKAKRVAIKKSNTLRNDRLIEYEASILSRLNHENILPLYAINKSGTKMAIEFMQLGNLGNAAESFKFSKANILRILKDIASGMEYLSEKKYLHRDLACRNVFLNNRKQCKIGDFALCVYVGDKDGVYVETEYNPQDYNISPETLLFKEFRVATDIWAMGILAWEFYFIVDHANERPPASFTKTLHLHRFQNLNGNLPKPANCPKKLYSYIMEELLNDDPEGRPSFSNIKLKIIEIMADKH